LGLKFGKKKDRRDFFRQKRVFVVFAWFFRDFFGVKMVSEFL